MKIYLCDSVADRPIPLDFSLDGDPQTLDMAAAVYTTPLHFVGQVVLEAEHAVVTLTVSYGLAYSCYRCGQPSECQVSYTTDYEYPYDDEAFSGPNGEYLDIDYLIMEATQLSVPSMLVCREDCAGLCPMCGRDRNHVKCGCVPPPEEPADDNPFAELQGLFDDED